MTTRSVRLDQSLVAAAERAAVANRRSTAQQLDYWLRLGSAIAQSESAARTKILRAVDGELPLAVLTEGERDVANAEIDARIAEAGPVTFADRLAAEGVATVTMDDQGQLIRREPDGTTSVISSESVA